MNKHKILAVISVSGVPTEDDAVSTLEHMLATWEEHKATWMGMGRSQIDITIKSILK